MKKHFLLFFTLQCVLAVTQAQTLNISCSQSNIGCAPYKTVFYNTSIGVDSLEIQCDQTPSEIIKYKDSVVIIYNQGFTWDAAFYISFYGFTSDGRYIDSKTFPIKVFFSTSLPELEKDTLSLGDRVTVIDPSSGTFNDFYVDYGDGTIEHPFQFGTHLYKTPGSYTINATWESQCGPTSASLELLVLDTAFNPPPQVLFSVEDTICPNVPVQCSVTTNFPTQSLNFDYGGGLTDQSTHTFSSPGVYPVKTIVTDLHGKVVELTDTVVVLGRLNSRRLTEITPLYARLGETISFKTLGNFNSEEWIIRLPKSKWFNGSNKTDKGISLVDYKKGYVVLKDIDCFQKEFYKYGLYTVTFSHNTCGVKQRETIPVAIFPQRIKSLDEFSGADENLNEQLKNTSENATIYPNPVVNNCSLKLPAWADQDVIITIINSLGQTVTKHSFKEVFANEVSIDVNTLQSGNYFLKLESNNQNQVVRFFKR